MDDDSSLKTNFHCTSLNAFANALSAGNDKRRLYSRISPFQTNVAFNSTLLYYKQSYMYHRFYERISTYSVDIKIGIMGTIKLSKFEGALSNFRNGSELVGSDHEVSMKPCFIVLKINHAVRD